MYWSVRRVFYALFAVPALWPVALWAQTDQMAIDRSLPGKIVAVSPTTQPSGDFSQDATFLTLLKARDDTLAQLGELRRITSYHEKFKNGLGVLFASPPSGTVREAVKKLDDELERLKGFEGDINTKKDEVVQNDLAKTFDRDYPLRLSQRSPFSPRTEFIRGESSSNIFIIFALKERGNADEVFRGVSPENRSSCFP